MAAGFDDGLIRVLLSGWKEPASVSIEAVDTIRGVNPQVTLKGDTLRHIVTDGRIPFMSAIRITSEGVTQAIYLSDVTSVHQRRSKNAKWVFLGLGGITDAFVLYLVSNIQIGPDRSRDIR